MKPCSDLTLYVGSNNVIELRSLTNAVTGAEINDATVTAVITDLLDVELPGQVWPLSMVPTGTDGTYQGTLEASIAISNGKQYKGTVTAISDGIERTWYPVLEADKDNV